MIGEPPDVGWSLERSDVLAARIEALRSAVLSSERSAPVGAVLDRAGEFEEWLMRDLAPNY